MLCRPSVGGAFGGLHTITSYASQSGVPHPNLCTTVNKTSLFMCLGSLGFFLFFFFLSHPKIECMNFSSPRWKVSECQIRGRSAASHLLITLYSLEAPLISAKGIQNRLKGRYFCVPSWMLDGEKQFSSAVPSKFWSSNRAVQHRF